MGSNEIPKSVLAAIKKRWPGGVIEEFEVEAAYFGSIRRALERDLRSICGANLQWQTEEKESYASWDDDEEDWQDEPLDEPWCSYHLFFLVPHGVEFRFEDETEGMNYDEETGETASSGEICPGEGWIGCVVGICLGARIAAVTLDSYSQFEDGSRHCPDIGPSMFSVETSQPIDPFEHYSELLGEDTFGKLEQLREKIGGVLEKHRIRVLQPSVLDLPVPDLTASEEVFLQPPVRVRDAFFFRGV